MGGNDSVPLHLYLSFYELLKSKIRTYPFGAQDAFFFLNHTYLPGRNVKTNHCTKNTPGKRRDFPKTAQIAPEILNLIMISLGEALQYFLRRPRTM